VAIGSIGHIPVFAGPRPATGANVAAGPVGGAGREAELDAQTLQAVQQPLRDAYRQHPQQVMITLRRPRRAQCIRDAAFK